LANEIVIYGAKLETAAKMSSFVPGRWLVSWRYELSHDAQWDVVRC